MILTYSHKTFPELITTDIKIHSIRKRGRWAKGKKIHHWMHNPRNVHKKPYFFLLNECTGTQPIVILPEKWRILVDTERNGKIWRSVIDWRTLAINDGFNTNPDEFWNWFTKPSDDLEIVHWTDFRY